MPKKPARDSSSNQVIPHHFQHCYPQRVPRPRGNDPGSAWRQGEAAAPRTRCASSGQRVLVPEVPERDRTSGDGCGTLLLSPLRGLRARVVASRAPADGVPPAPARVTRYGTGAVPPHQRSGTCVMTRLAPPCDARCSTSNRRHRDRDACDALRGISGLDLSTVWPCHGTPTCDRIRPITSAAASGSRPEETPGLEGLGIESAGLPTPAGAACREAEWAARDCGHPHTTWKRSTALRCSREIVIVRSAAPSIRH
jgi:hypothetical protein